MRTLIIVATALAGGTAATSCTNYCRGQTCAYFDGLLTCGELSQLGCECDGCCSLATPPAPAPPRAPPAAPPLDCPCLTSFDGTGVTVNGSSLLVNISGVAAWYPSTYGLSNCSAHDVGLPPSCSNASNAETSVADSPGWCFQSWCFVSPARCNRESALSALAGSANLSFSYAACSAYAFEYDTSGRPPVLPAPSPPLPPPRLPPPLQPPLPPDGSFSVVDVSGFISTDRKYIGAAAATNGLVVFGPFNADGVGVFDPDSLEFSTVDITSSFSATTGFKYDGATATRNGLVMFAPFFSRNVGVFNALNRTFSAIPVPNPGFQALYSGATTADDGLVYFAPRWSRAIGIVDPESLSYSEFSIEGAVPHTERFNGAASSHGLIIFAPYTANSIGIFDPAAQSFSTVDISDTLSIRAKYHGAYPRE